MHVGIGLVSVEGSIKVGVGISPGFAGSGSGWERIYSRCQRRGSPYKNSIQISFKYHWYTH